MSYIHGLYVVKQSVELFRIAAHTVACLRLKATYLPVLIEAFLVVKHIPGRAEIIIESHPDIAPSVLGEDCIAVRIDVLRVLQPQLEHRRNCVLETVRTDECTVFGHLLDRLEGGIDTAAVLSFVLLLDEREAWTQPFSGLCSPLP